MNELAQIFQSLAGLAFLVGVTFLYFVPYATARGKRNENRVLALNILLGWTIIGWVVALAWAADGEKKKIAMNKVTAPILLTEESHALFCQRCGASNFKDARFCKICGRSSFS